jgi:hypothetical protein
MVEAPMRLSQHHSNEPVTGKAAEKPENVSYAVGLMFIYLVAGVVIALTAGYFWWAGLVLFAIFILYSLVELLFNGSILALVIFTLYVAIKYAQRMGFRLENFDRAKAKFIKAAELSLPLFALNFMLVVELISLGYYLFVVL